MVKRIICRRSIFECRPTAGNEPYRKTAQNNVKTGWKRRIGKQEKGGLKFTGREKGVVIKMTGSVLMGKYELKSRIGTGGSSIVYLAWDRHLERDVAVKEEKDAEKAKDNSILKKEMEMLKALNHPMLPAVYDYFQETKRYLVMEYIGGESLHNYIEREGRIPEEQACKWALQLSELFSYLHGQKPPVIYRDLKPDNIIVCPDGNLRVVDFGTALHRSYHKRNAENLAGTAGYAAPEQLYRKAGGNKCGRRRSDEREDAFEAGADERSDIYTLGATLYHMLTGHDPARPPYGIRPVRCMNPELTANIERIVEKCTEEEAERRYQTVEELKTDLEKRKLSGGRFFCGSIGRKRRNQYPLRKLEKRIWLTEKRTTGLFTVGLLLCGLCTGLFSIRANGRETPLPVIVYNRQGQKIIIRYDSIYTPEGNLLFELEQELFREDGTFELSVGLTECATGRRRERIFYIQGGGAESGN